MKTYNIQLSISGDSETLEFIYDVLSMEAIGNDFINLSMDVFKKTFEDDLLISSMMVSGTCELESIKHNGSTVSITLVSRMPVPFGWLHAFSYAFDGAEFTVYTTDESGEELVLQYGAGHYKGGGYNHNYFFNNNILNNRNYGIN